MQVQTPFRTSHSTRGMGVEPHIRVRGWAGRLGYGALPDGLNARSRGSRVWNSSSHHLLMLEGTRLYHTRGYVSPAASSRPNNLLRRPGCNIPDSLMLPLLERRLSRPTVLAELGQVRNNSAAVWANLSVDPGRRLLMASSARNFNL